MDHKQTVDTGPSGHQFLSFARPLYIYEVMWWACLLLAFYFGCMHWCMVLACIAYINMYMHAFCREKINKMETDIQREQSIIYMPWLLVWSDQQRRNHIDRSMQCNAIAVGACMHAPRSQLLFHACIALHLHGRSTYVYTCVRILELAVRWNVSVAYIVSGCPAGASIVSLCCCQSLQQVHISMYMHVCLCLCFRTSAVCCYSSEP